MVLSGLAFSSWQAWLAGTYFVRKPWGLPSPTGFCFHPYILYAFTLNLISHTFWIDCQIKVYPLSSQLSLTEKIMADAVIFLTTIFDIYFRFTFYRLNGPLTELLIALEQPKYKPFNRLLRKCWKFHKKMLWVITIPRYVIAITLVCAFGTLTSVYPDSAFYLPRYIYFGLFLFFTAIPSVSTIIFAYDLIVVTTFQMLWTFEDYCAHLEDHIYKGHFLRKRYSMNPTPSIKSLVISSKAAGGDGGGFGTENNQKCGENEFRNLKRLSDAEEGNGFERMSYKCFVERFDWINGLADKYNRCMGPILLGIVTRCVFSIVHSINAIVLKSGSAMALKTWFHVMVLLVEASQLVILKLGSETHERISFWKSKLNKACLITSSSAEKIGLERRGESRLNSTLESEDFALIMGDVEYDNQLVQDLVKYVCTWDWKVSAAGIFNIDKTLLSGIVSTTLTYVIILFQLHLADPKPTLHVSISSFPDNISQSIFDLSAYNSTDDYL